MALCRQTDDVTEVYGERPESLHLPPLDEAVDAKINRLTKPKRAS